MRTPRKKGCLASRCLALAILFFVSLPWGSATAQEPAIDIGAVSVAGPLPRAAVRAVLREALGRARQCYRQGLERTPSLSGTVRLRLFVASDGVPVVAEVKRSTLGDRETEACLQRFAETVLRFAERDADSHVSFELRLGDHRNPSGREREVTAGPGDPDFDGARDTEGIVPGPPTELRARVRSRIVGVRGSRDQEEVERALRRSEGLLRACYERILVEAPETHGLLRFRFAVGRDGQTTEPTALRGPLRADEAIRACVYQAVDRLRFDATSEASRTRVEAELDFSPPRAARPRD